MENEELRPYDNSRTECNIKPKDIVGEKKVQYAALGKRMRLKMYNDMKADEAKGKPWHVETNIALNEVMAEKGELDGELVRL